MNRLIIIGWTGIRTAYLNVSREEAIARYKRENGDEDPEEYGLVEEVEFVDEFHVY